MKTLILNKMFDRWIVEAGIRNKLRCVETFVLYYCLSPASSFMIEFIKSVVYYW